MKIILNYIQLIILKLRVQLVIERFDKTFKNMMYKKFTENNNTIFYNILDELVNNYNNKYHLTIKMTPIEASKKINEKKIKNIYNFEKN